MRAPMALLLTSLVLSGCADDGQTAASGPATARPNDAVEQACAIATLDWQDSGDRPRMQEWARAALDGKLVQPGVPADLNDAATDLALALAAGPAAPRSPDGFGDLFHEHLLRKQEELRDACSD